MGEEGPNQAFVLGFTPKISQKHEKWSSLSPFFSDKAFARQKRRQRGLALLPVYMKYKGSFPLDNDASQHARFKTKSLR